MKTPNIYISFPLTPPKYPLGPPLYEWTYTRTHPEKQINRGLVYTLLKSVIRCSRNYHHYDTNSQKQVHYEVSLLLRTPQIAEWVTSSRRVTLAVLAFPRRSASMMPSLMACSWLNPTFPSPVLRWFLPACLRTSWCLVRVIVDRTAIITRFTLLLASTLLLTNWIVMFRVLNLPTSRTTLVALWLRWLSPPIRTILFLLIPTSSKLSFLWLAESLDVPLANTWPVPIFVLPSVSIRRLRDRRSAEI